MSPASAGCEEAIEGKVAGRQSKHHTGNKHYECSKHFVTLVRVPFLTRHQAASGPTDVHLSYLCGLPGSQ
jgi:hypothetical protein